MKTYEFTVTETLKRTVRVDAESRGEAESIVENLYDNEKIVLDADDIYGEANIECVHTYNTPIEESEYGISHFAKSKDGIVDKFDK